ncbi:hypothetical protein ABZ763_12735 [Streptomyces bacillaris]|uniref:hypothetical protein n=1 Tax=Streptomyces bacillaris TaxID=68179 RepID=UPI003460BA99
MGLVHCQLQRLAVLLATLGDVHRGREGDGGGQSENGTFICDLYSRMDGTVWQPAAASGAVVVAVVLA